ncbi:glycosyltransferase [Synechococcus moorigangaii CMS01]|nr:glycosyltransferase [Synechococcus moorigangaii CMS01]
MNNTVSVITRTRRRPDFLRRALSSIAAQHLPGGGQIEWVIVNDDLPSTAVADIAQNARDQGLACVQIDTGMEAGGGRSAAANAGVRAASGWAYLLHDDDDTLAPGALAALSEALAAEPDFAASACGVEEVNETGAEDFNPSASASPMFQRDCPLSLIEVAYRNPLPPIGLMVRRSAFDNAGGYDDSLPVLEDWEFLLRLLMHGEVECIPRLLARHHRRTAEGDAANSADDLHRRWDIIIRNRLLRADINTGATGMGALANVHDRTTGERLNKLLGTVSGFARRFGHKPH